MWMCQELHRKNTLEQQYYSNKSQLSKIQYAIIHSIYVARDSDRPLETILKSLFL